MKLDGQDLIFICKMKGWDSRVTTSYYKQPLLSRCRQSYPLYKNFIVYPHMHTHTHPQAILFEKSTYRATPPD